MEAKQRASVLLEDPSALAASLPKIARVVAQTLGEHPTDVASKVRYGAGIVVRDVAELYAREIARGLASLGIGSFLVAQPAFEPAPRPRRVGQFDFDASGVTVAQRLRPPETVPWAAVRALHAHASIEATSGEEDEGPSRRGGDLTRLSDAAKKVLGDLREFEDKERTRVVLGIDVLVGTELYRMTSNDAGIYGSLAARSTIALENYLSLVDALVRAAPASVLIPSTTRRFVADHDFTRVLHAKREELEAFNTWIVQALEHGVAASEAEPEDLADEGLEDADEAILVAKDAQGDGDDPADEVDDAELEDDTKSFNRARALAQQAPARPSSPDRPLDNSAFDDDDAADLSDEELEEADADANDPEVAEAAKLFDKTGRFKAEDVNAILADMKSLDGAEVDQTASADPDDPEVREALGFFETNPSGKWDLKQVTEGVEDVGQDELEAADPKAKKSKDA